jgi:hypothetical protein
MQRQSSKTNFKAAFRLGGARGPGLFEQQQNQQQSRS